MNKIKNVVVFSIFLAIVSVCAYIFGTGLGTIVLDTVYGTKCHMCPCESCKVRRQLECIEVIDSIIKDRIVFEVNDTRTEQLGK